MKLLCVGPSYHGLQVVLKTQTECASSQIAIGFSHNDPHEIKTKNN